MESSKAVLNIPNGIRNIAFAVLAFFVVGSAYTIAYIIRNGDALDGMKADVLLIALAVLQLSLSGFFVLFIVLNSSRAWSGKGIEKATRSFFNVDLKTALEKISFYEDPRPVVSNRKNQTGFSAPTTLEIHENVDIFGNVFSLTCNQRLLNLWIGLNVNRIFVIYWIRDEEHRSLDDIKRIFEFTFGGAQKLGYSVNYEKATLKPAQGSAKDIISIWLTVKVDDDEFIAAPAQRLFWAQDIAMMTESFWRTAERNGVRMSDELPAPL